MAEQPVSYLEPWQGLRDKVVMVTGASSGIGREFCVDLAKAGCRIIAAARRTERLHLLCDQINQFPSLSSYSSNSTSALGDSTVRAVAVELDVCADGLAIEASVQKAWNAFGRIDVLINNAGVRGSIRSPLHISEEEWNNTLKTNLTGAWLVSKYVCIRMRDAKLGGSIINISSIVGLNRGQLPGAAAYIASKTGLSALTKDMALELGEHKINVNSISPGIFRSEITEKLMQKDWLGKVVEKIVPLRDHGTIDPALTSLVRYLIHDSSKYVTGNIFIVDAALPYQGEYNIKVNSISPGLFKFEITEKLMQMDRLGNVVKRVIPLKDLGTVDPALTSIIRYLIHDFSAYITSNIFIVDASTMLPDVPIFSFL